MKKEIQVCDFCVREDKLAMSLQLPYMDYEIGHIRTTNGITINSHYTSRKRTIKQMDICQECLNHIGDMAYQFDRIKKVNQNRPIHSISLKVTTVD